jgi:peptidoglycan/xylan/chitin deacetylase (PgdA/CDA1 family)
MRFVKFLLGTFIGAAVISSSVLAGLSIFLFSGKYTVPVMMYHHVSSQSAGADSVSPENFRRHLEYLKKHHYHVLRLGELVEKIESGQPLPKRSVVLAFDDGYEDNYKAAFPILKEFQFPAIFFIPPKDVGTQGYMTWKQIKEMKAAGFDFGSHGMTQAYLPDLSANQLKYEIIESKRVLEKQLKTRIDYIAYPVGGFNEEVVALVKTTGYKAGLTTNRGYDRYDRDL